MDYLTHFFRYFRQIISKIEIWVSAGGKIMKTRKTDIASKQHHELSSDVTSHRVILQILYSFHLKEWNFEYDMFRATACFV